MAAAAEAPAPVIGTPSHPRGLYALVGVEIWERFGWYTVLGLLILWITAPAAAGGLGWEKAAAFSALGLFTGLTFASPLAGGWLGDRWLGHRRAALAGTFAFIVGYAILAAAAALRDDRLLLVAMGLLIVGTGLFKPNASVMVGRLYTPGDSRLDGAYTLFWTGINIGAFLSSLTAGYLAERVGWEYAFGSAAAGMILGLGVFLATWRLLPADARVPAAAAADRRERRALTFAERRRLAVIACLVLFGGLFNAAFGQFFGLVNVYVFERADRVIAGFEVPGLWVLSLNQLTILAIAPLASALWVRLARQGRNPADATKFATAFALLAAAFVVLALTVPANSTAQVAIVWVALAVILMGLAEIFVQPIGLSMASRLAPAHLAGPVMGGWFLAYAIAYVGSGQLGVLAARIGDAPVFQLTAVTCVAAMIVLALARARLTRWSQMGDSTPGRAM